MAQPVGASERLSRVLALRPRFAGRVRDGVTQCLHILECQIEHSVTQLSGTPLAARQ